MGDVIWLADALKRNGKIPFEEVAGWRDRGHGDLIDDKPFMHHTGSFNETANGIAFHPDLGLCSQTFIKKGKVWICGAGVAWHAGTGSGFGLPKNNGNYYSQGIEAAHDGRAAWDPYHLNNYLELIRVMNRHRGKPLNDVVAHKEYGAIQGKWDPGNLDMKWVRQALMKDSQPAQTVVINMINLEAAEKGNAWIGKRLTQNEQVVGRDKKGRYVAFENAHIYFHPSTGAYVVPHGGLFESWGSYGYEVGQLGYPVRDWTKLPAGAVQSFQGGVLYRKDGQPGFIVKGVIGQRWALEGFEKGQLGYPTSNEIPNGTGGVYQTFEHGSLEWDRSGAVKDLGLAATDMTKVNASGFPLATEHVIAA